MHMLIVKKDGSNRPVIDFRRLNRITVFDAEPMPNVDDIFLLVCQHLGTSQSLISAKVTGRFQWLLMIARRQPFALH